MWRNEPRSFVVWWTLRDSWEIKSAFHRAFQLPVLLGSHVLGTSVHFRSKTVTNVVCLVAWAEGTRWSGVAATGLLLFLPFFHSACPSWSCKYSFIRLPQGEKSASVSYPLRHSSDLAAHVLTSVLFSSRVNLKCKPCSVFWHKKPTAFPHLQDSAKRTAPCCSAGNFPVDLSWFLGPLLLSHPPPLRCAVYFVLRWSSPLFV